jgi:hypothetical protein
LPLNYGGLPLTNINKKSLLYAAVFLLGGCLNEQNIAGEINNEANNPAKKIPDQTCNIPKDAFSKLPTEVLDGTDVADLSSFKPANISGVHFHAEIGGANIEIDAQVLNELYKIQRIYKEPDLENIVTNYNNLCVKEGRLYGENVRGIFTEKGILWLELKSGNEFISSDLWIYLEKN